MNSAKSGPDSKFLKRVIVRIRTKSKKIRYSPGPVHSNSSPVLVSEHWSHTCLPRLLVWRCA